MQADATAQPETPGPTGSPGTELAMGEYHDLTLSWRKWRDDPNFGAGPLTRFVVPAMMGFGFFATFHFVVALAMALLGVVPLSVIRLGIDVAVGVGCLSIAARYTGEPLARVRRVYGAAGRVDILVFGSLESYTRAAWSLAAPEPGARAPGRIEFLGPGGRTRRLRLTPKDAGLVRRLWALPEIAPPFGQAPHD